MKSLEWVRCVSPLKSYVESSGKSNHNKIYYYELSKFSKLGKFQSDNPNQIK